MKNEALMVWLKGKKLSTSEGELHADLIYAFESCGTYYAATVTEGQITAYLDQMITGTAGTLTVHPGADGYESVKLTVGEAATLLIDSPNDKILTPLTAEVAQAHKARQAAAFARGEVLQAGIRTEHELLLANLLPF
ncbi:hypothetical protein IHN32_10890 [Deinococcus sp. 14RED07]|uniref:hypothetical protein n=1 Tax=Deinococcus sp. 14RED07 TaxID=2745874 RepID=UPI001E3AAC2A|nr:hypothetical protein [Deinococcus sp. 14RED07]MCD0176449.1 hypothetical protein [Deinococcus sp. 14RED07]